MKIVTPARRHGRSAIHEERARAALAVGVRVVESRDGRLHHVHLGAGDQLMREPLDPALRGRAGVIAFGDLETRE